ncbi:MAG: hypothetical protein QNJ00_01755 [Woeseiaceae bacterium]|nr:hypothetical protein [Woeseiaceae bacterium]
MFNLRNTKYSIIPMMLILMFGTRVTLAAEPGTVPEDAAATAMFLAALPE